MKKSIFLLLITVGMCCSACGATTNTGGDSVETDPGDQQDNITDGSVDLGGKCTKKSHCKGDNVCKNKVCVVPPAPECNTHGECKATEQCVDHQCVLKDDKCANISCQQYYGCEEGICVPKCSPEVLCGGACCNDSQTCFDNSCIAKPPKTDKQGDVLCRTTNGQPPVYCEKENGCFATKTGGYICQKLLHECDEKESFCRIKEYCDRGQKTPTGAGRCVERTDDLALCTIDATFAPTPKPILTWNSPTSEPLYKQVMSAPAVANIFDNNNDHKLDGNDTSEIIFTTYSGSAYTSPGVLRVISGKPVSDTDTSAVELWNSRSIAEPFYTSPVVTPAIGDIDHDGYPDIVIDTYEAGSKDAVNNHAQHKLIAIKGDGSERLWTTDFGIFYPNTERWATEAQSFDNRGPQLIDLDQDGNTEIIAQSIIYDHEGNRICSLKEDGRKFPSVQAAIDFDGDGRKELVTGNAIFAFEIDESTVDEDGFKPDTIPAKNKKVCKKLSQQTYANINGLSVADVTGDGKPNLVGIDAKKGIIIEKVDPNTFVRTEIKRIPVPLDYNKAQDAFHVDCHNPSNANHKGCEPGGGIPNIADFDGADDNMPEIGVAGRYYYIVAKPDGTILWAHKTTDFSSAVTSSSVFDFDGDGKAEVVYNDEEKLRIYSGKGTGNDADGDGYNDAEIRLETDNTTGTLRDYPVIADVNHDGHANLVVGANDLQRRHHGNVGIRVFAEQNNQWVPTRTIWNQFTYYVTNVNDDASIPQFEKQNWTLPWLNNALQNVQAGNPFLAPNLVPVIKSVGNVTCDATSGAKNIVFDIQNKGDKIIKAHAANYRILAEKSDGTTITIDSGTNKNDIPAKSNENVVKDNWTIPSEFQNETFSIKVELDQNQTVQECKEDDNVATINNIRGSAPNFKVNINTTSCYNAELVVNFEVSNDGALADTPTAKIFLGRNKNNLKEVGTVTFDQDININESVAKTFSLDIDRDLYYQELYVRVVVNEENKARECNANDNEQTVKLESVCYING